MVHSVTNRSECNYCKMDDTKASKQQDKDEIELLKILGRKLGKPELTGRLIATIREQRKKRAKIF